MNIFGVSGCYNPNLACRTFREHHYFVEQRNTGLSMNFPLAYRWLASLLCNHFHVDFPVCSSLCLLFFLTTQMLIV